MGFPHSSINIGSKKFGFQYQKGTILSFVTSSFRVSGPLNRLNETRIRNNDVTHTIAQSSEKLIIFTCVKLQVRPCILRYYFG